jgi:uncharacterized membrane protein
MGQALEILRLHLAALSSPPPRAWSGNGQKDLLVTARLTDAGGAIGFEGLRYSKDQGWQALRSLEPLLGKQSIVGFSINENRDMLVGLPTDDGQERFLALENGSLVSLNPTGAAQSVACLSVNEKGQTCGVKIVRSTNLPEEENEENAWYFDPDLGLLEDLGTPSGTSFYEISEDGHAVGIRRNKAIISYSPRRSPAVHVLVSRKKLARLFTRPGAEVSRVRTVPHQGALGASSRGDLLAEAEALVDGVLERRYFLYLNDGKLLDVAKEIAAAEWDWSLSGEDQPENHAQESPRVELLPRFYGPNNRGELAWLTRIDGSETRILVFSP